MSIGTEVVALMPFHDGVTYRLREREVRRKAEQHRQLEEVRRPCPSDSACALDVEIHRARRSGVSGPTPA
jgi:hypothetical protein